MLLLARKYCVLVDIFPKKFRPERRFPHRTRESAFPTTQNPPLLRLFQYSSTPPRHYILSAFPARGRFVSARVVPRRTSHELTVGGNSEASDSLVVATRFYNRSKAGTLRIDIDFHHDISSAGYRARCRKIRNHPGGLQRLAFDARAGVQA